MWPSSIFFQILAEKAPNFRRRFDGRRSIADMLLLGQPRPQPYVIYWSLPLLRIQLFCCASSLLSAIVGHYGYCSWHLRNILSGVSDADLWRRSTSATFPRSKHCREYDRDRTLAGDIYACRRYLFVRATLDDNVR